MLSITKKLESLTDQELLILSQAINLELITREDGGENISANGKGVNGKKTPLRMASTKNGCKRKK
jgi:hypothetical protein